MERSSTLSTPYPPNQYQPDPYNSGNANPYAQPSSNYSQFDGGYSQPQPTYSQPPEGYSQPQGGYSQPPAYGQPIYQQQPMMMVAQPQTNNKALISMILGICSWVLGLSILTGIPAIVLGHSALRELRLSGGTQSGNGMAITGLVLGYASLIGLVALCLFLIFVFGLFGIAASQGG
jgi:hypothetical protein